MTEKKLKEKIAKILARESGHGEGDWEENNYLDIAEEILNEVTNYFKANIAKSKSKT